MERLTPGASGSIPSQMLFLKTPTFQRLSLSPMRVPPSSNNRGSEGLPQLAAPFTDALSKVDLCFRAEPEGWLALLSCPRKISRHPCTISYVDAGERWHVTELAEDMRPKPPLPG